VTFPDPADVLLPLGPMPTEPGEALDKWLKLYKEQLDLRETALNLQAQQEEREQTLAQAAAQRERAELELEQTRLSVAKARLELSDLERSQRESGAAAKHARVYFFSKTVSKKSVAEAIEALGLWSRRDPGADIRIVINSPGGEVVQGLALFDFLGELRALGHRLTTVVIGEAASFGAILMQAGDVRLIGHNASVLLHEVAWGIRGKISYLEDDLEFGRSLQRRLLIILASRSRLTEAEISARWSRKDWWLTAEEVVELGLADGISHGPPTEAPSAGEVEAAVNPAATP
jgi:ATP-dependent Clp protease, protease subunit